jgi:predicted MFS family arabinose efflux permease
MSRALYVAPPLFVVFIDAMAVAVLAPVLAPLVENPPPDGLMSDLSPSARSLVYGIALGIQPLLVVCSAPLLGQLSDKFGRKRLMLFTMIGLGLSNIGVGLAITSGWVFFLFLGRIIVGLTAGNQAIAQAALVDISPPEKKAFYLSLALLFSSLGFLAGPLLGGWLADSSLVPWFQPDLPFYVLGALSALTVAQIALFFPETQHPKSAQPGLGTVDLMAGFRSLVESFRDQSIRRISFTFFLMQMAWASYFLFLPTFLVATEGFSQAEIGTFMAVMGAGFCVSYAVGLPLLAKFWSAAAITRWGLLLTAAGMLGGALAGRGVLQWLVLVPTGFVVSIAYGAILTLYSDAVDASQQGRILGISIAVVNLAWGLISIVSGYLTAVSAWAPIGVAAGLMALSFLVALTLRSVDREADVPQPSSGA